MWFEIDIDLLCLTVLNAHCLDMHSCSEATGVVVPPGFGPLLLLAAIFIIIIFIFFPVIRGFLGALTCSKTLENWHTHWNLQPLGRRRG